MTKKSRSRYSKRPQVPTELQSRFEAVQSVLSGESTTPEAAARLDLSRVQMQSIVHRAEEAIVSSLVARPPGPSPKRTDRERELEAENERLRERLVRAEQRAAMLQRFTETAGALIRGAPSTRRGPRSRGSRSEPETKPTTTPGAKDPDPDPTRELALATVEELRRSGMTADAAARAIKSGPSTVRRWRRRVRSGALPRQRPRPRVSAPMAPAIAERAESVVRATRGQIGADALRRAVGCAISRRDAARLKSSVRTSMERARQARTERIEIIVPGALRGFDGVHIGTSEGPQWLLIASDGAVPYRTSIVRAGRYDERAVLAAIEADVDEHGAPLVWRMDRAKAHGTPAVRALLRARGIVLLQGPPHLPRFYGQHERQNRDLRAVVREIGVAPGAELTAQVVHFSEVQNAVWPRRSLGWATPKALWTARSDLRDNRIKLHAEVQHRAARHAARLPGGPAAEDLAMRLAIEDALESRGYLRRMAG